MGLSGELSTIGLAEVLSNLAFNRLTGTLSLHDGERKARILVEEGRVRAVARSDVEFDYVAIARLAGAAPDEILDKAMQAQRRRTLRAYLRACGSFDEAAYDDAVASQVQEEILPLFGWACGAFEFEEGKPKQRSFDREQFDCPIQLDPQGLAMEAARRRDELRTMAQFVPADGTILVPSGLPLPDGEDPVTAGVAPLVDGTRDLAAVVAEARLKKFDVFRCVARLVEAGVLAPATPERLRELAAQSRAAGEIHLAVRRLEQARALAPDDAQTLADLVRGYERSGRKPEAGRTQLRLADVQAAQGDVAGALDSYERAGLLAPENLDIAERIFEFHRAHGEPARAIKAGRRLAEALTAQEMYEDAVPFYERLLAGNERNADLRTSLARCLLRAGDTDRGVAELLALGNHAFQEGDFEVALRHYREAREADPLREEAADRIRDIESGRAARTRAWRRRLRFVAVLALIVGLLGWQVVREWHAWGALHTASLASTVDLGRANDDRARAATMRRYAEVCVDFPFTRSSGLARETLQALLRAELGQVAASVERAVEARTTVDVEFTLGRARKVLALLAAIPLPDDLDALRAAESDRLGRRIDALMAR